MQESSEGTGNSYSFGSQALKTILLLEQDAFSSLAIRTGFQMFGIDCDIALNAKLALELICKRIATEDIDAMYKLIVIDKSFNSFT